MKITQTKLISLTRSLKFRKIESKNYKFYFVILRKGFMTKTGPYFIFDQCD